MKNVFVPSLPVLPSYEEYCTLIKSIWDSNFLTNFGPLHGQFQEQLSAYLGVPDIGLFVNGHAALEAALMTLGKDGGEIITTPFTFASTAQAIVRCGFTPVYCDIDPETYNLDPVQARSKVSDRTVAILGVHVFGNPCYPTQLQDLAAQHGLTLIFDAAHAVGISYGGQSIATFGDLSMFSLHATKVLNSIEGGVLVARDLGRLVTARQIQNFGIPPQEGGEWLTGFNGKMNEFQAAMGILNLKNLPSGVANRRSLYEAYRSLLAGKKGISFQRILDDTEYNYSYLTISIDPAQQGGTRDDVLVRLSGAGIIARKYFYPLCSEKIGVRGQSEVFPYAKFLADSILALPLHDSLTVADVEFIVQSMELV